MFMPMVLVFQWFNIAPGDMYSYAAGYWSLRSISGDDGYRHGVCWLKIFLLIWNYSQFQLTPIAAMFILIYPWLDKEHTHAYIKTQQSDVANYSVDFTKIKPRSLYTIAN